MVLPKRASVILKKSKSNNLSSWLLKDRTINPLLNQIKLRFPIETRQYFAGFWDGDGYQGLRYHKKQSKSKTLHCQLELAEKGCEPVLELSKIFDLTVTYKKPRHKNHQPSYAVHLSGPKGKMFLLLIQPYLIEKHEQVYKILLEMGCPEKMLITEKTFSWPYLAGYADAEGNYTMKLHHYKQKHGRVGSTYKFRFMLTSNDFKSLTFIKNKIIEKGFKFIKDYIKRYKNVSPREHRHPERWKPTLDIQLGGGSKELARFYKNFYQYALIEKKREVINKTIEYSHLIFRQ